MEIKLGQLIYTKQYFEKSLEERLLEMDCYFQDNLWDGYSDQDDPKFISKEDFEAIEALTNKIKHMCLNIGCPISVEPMLLSIVNRKLKRWQGSDTIETKDHTVYLYDEKKGRGETKLSVRGFKKGKQLKSIDQIARVKKSVGYYKDNGLILCGHFRWNNRGYILSRRATDLLGIFINSKF